MSLTQEQTETRLRNLASECRAAGIRLTRQRMAILHVLAGSDAHPDAEIVYRCVRKRLPRISLDTVYRTLGSLEALGIVGKISAFHGAARFDPNTSPHHHVVCTRCGRITDFVSSELDALGIPVPLQSWGKIRSVHAELRGVCSECLDPGEQAEAAS